MVLFVNMCYPPVFASPAPQSWAFGALTFERRAALYGIYAALYGSPLLLRGLDWQDPWVIGVLALGVLHVQVGAREARGNSVNRQGEADTLIPAREE